MAKITEKPKPKKKATHAPKKVTRLKEFSFTAEDGVLHQLTEQQKTFSELFCNMSMNGVQAIIGAGYNVTNKWGKINYKLAAVMAKENLLKPNIKAYVRSLYAKSGLNDDSVEKELLAAINQNAELSSKVRAIDIYYKKQGAYASDKNDDKFNSTLQEMADTLASKLP